MRKSSAVLVLVVILGFLGIMAYAVRTAINFNRGDPLAEYISHADLLAMTYDLLYYSAWMIALLCGVIIVLLVYLLLLVESLVIQEAPEQSASKKAPAKDKKKVVPKQKTWPPPEEAD